MRIYNLGYDKLTIKLRTQSSFSFSAIGPRVCNAIAFTLVYICYNTLEILSSLAQGGMKFQPRLWFHPQAWIFSL